MSNSVYVTLASSSHSKEEREENDFYATEPKATNYLLKLEKFQTNILEPMCGQGHIAKILEKKGHKVKAFDLVDRGYGKVKDLFSFNPKRNDFDIISNPPYKNSEKYVRYCLNLMTNKGQKTAFFLKVLFLEGKNRKELFRQYPPIRIWVSSSRLVCAKNGDFEKSNGSAVAYAWFIWEYGYKGDTIIKWFN